MEELIKQLDKATGGLSRIAGLTEVLQSVESAFGGINAAINKLPEGKIQSLIQGVGSLSSQFVKFWESLAEAFQPLIYMISDQLVTTLSLAFDKIIGFGGGVMSWLEENKTIIVDFVSVVAMVIGTLILPVFQFLQEAIILLADNFNTLVEPLQTNQDLMDALLILVGSLASGFLIYAAYLKIVTFATQAWKIAQAALNATQLANPTAWIIAGIIALIAAISYVIYKTDGWGKQWEVLVNFMRALWNVVQNALIVGWLTAENFILSGIDKVKRAWFGMKSIMGDESAAGALSQLDNAQKQRTAELNAAKTALDASGTPLTWELSWNNERTLEGGLAEIKNKFSESGLTDMLGFGGKIPQVSSGEGISIPGLREKKPQIQGDEKILQNIATGGTSSSDGTVSLHVGNLVENLYIEHNDFEGAVEDMQEQVTDALIAALKRAQVAY